ncbi:Fe-S cluster assembly ATPase SufC [Clostridium sp. cel8]|jgi:Fe-S cluster assembly ATP-binding protein|uniref:Fe-S cluster assembly ATPase SufC n=1 Tax=unclassified Clostridium TaxID=2614128 RepID=UPI0015F4213A|nr:Fe-S cluster assembly ATPase SufC [Clostridium sp. cel8]MBA5850403.1 Fe-S cluster assembly ATPase SufC [Clostridium sp. cel8]
MESKLLKINDLKTRVGETEILKGLNLEIGKGEVHAIMGPNGAGKSTLVNTIMGHPKYSISSGDILFEGKSINEMKVDERARLGIFMSFQYPEEIQGITVENFLRTAKSAITGKKIGILKFRRQLKEKLNLLKIDESYSKRYLNVGFSGGEKKKNEILQMAVLEPKLAMLDETDSGLDVDAVRIVSEGVSKLRTEENSVLIITHHSSILEYLKPDYVHILVNGKIVKTGDASLAEEIEKNGYDAFKALA